MFKYSRCHAYIIYQYNMIPVMYKIIYSTFIYDLQIHTYNFIKLHHVKCPPPLFHTK